MMEYSEDEIEPEIKTTMNSFLHSTDVNQNYLIERLVTSTKSIFKSIHLLQRESEKLSNECSEENVVNSGDFQMNLRSHCNGDCVMQGLPHVHHHPHPKKKSPVPLEIKIPPTSPTKSSKDINDNLTSKKKNKTKIQQQTFDSSTISLNTSLSSLASSSDSLSLSYDSIHERYVDYLNSSQEDRDLNKTDYTYAHSYSYSRFVSESERFNWPVPNMSRQNIHTNSMAKLGSIDSIEKVTRKVEKKSNQKHSSSSSRMAKINLRTDFNPITSSTPTIGRTRRRNQFDGYSDDDEELAEATASHLKLNSSGSSHECSNLLTEEEATNLIRSNAELTEDEEEVYLKRIIKNTFIKSIYNYISGKKDESENFNIDKNMATTNMGHYPTSNSYYRSTISSRNKYLASNGNTYKNGSQYASETKKNVIIKWRWLLLFLPLLFFCYVIFGYSGHYLSNLLPDLSNTKIGLYDSILPLAINSHGDYVDPRQYEAEIHKLRQEVLAMKEVVHRQQQQKQQPEVSPSGLGESELNDILNKLRELELRITTCCQKNSTALIEEEVRLLVEGKWLAQFEKHYAQQLKTESERLKEHFHNFVHQSLQEAANSKNSGDSTISTVDSSTVELLIKKALTKYDADKTGEADYALESTGAYIISTRCSESYQIYSANYRIFGVSIWRSVNSPRELIQPRVVPGECWCFHGNSGRVAIHLSVRIVPTAFAYEHIPKALSREGNIASAPSSFKVYGLKNEDDREPELLGRYTYSIDGEPLQRFEVVKKDIASKGWSIIEMVVDENHGNLEYTCLYRLRVHGVPVSNNVS